MKHSFRNISSFRPGADLENFMTVAQGHGSLVGVVKPINSANVCCGVVEDSQNKLHILRT